MTKRDFIQLLKEKDACSEAVDWCTETSGSPQQLWDKCERGDWMLWLIGKIDPDHKKLVLTACKCARLALKYVGGGETRPLKAIETAEAWAMGEDGVTLDDVRDAADAAAYAAADAADAADAAALAGDAAADAAFAAADAAYAPYAAPFAASYAALAGVRKKTLKKCAEIVRKDWPKISELVKER